LQAQAEIEELIEELRAAAQRLGEVGIDRQEAIELVSNCAAIAGRLLSALEERTAEPAPTTQPPLAGPRQEPLL